MSPASSAMRQPVRYDAEPRCSPTQRVTEHAERPEAELMPIAHDVLRGAFVEPAWPNPTGPEVREALRRLCDAAQGRGIGAERLQLMLKAASREVPEARRAMRDHDGSALSCVITLCIEEYFATGRHPRRVDD